MMAAIFPVLLLFLCGNAQAQTPKTPLPEKVQDPTASKPQAAPAKPVAAVFLRPQDPTRLIFKDILPLQKGKEVALRAKDATGVDLTISPGFEWTSSDPKKNITFQHDDLHFDLVLPSKNTTNITIHGETVSGSNGTVVNELPTITITVQGTDPKPFASVKLRVVDMAVRFGLKLLNSSGQEQDLKEAQGLVILNNAAKPTVLRAAAYQLDDKKAPDKPLESALETWTIQQNADVLQFDVDATRPTSGLQLSDDKLTAFCFNSTPVKLTPRGPGKATVIIKNHASITLGDLVPPPEIRIEITVAGDVEKFELSPGQVSPLYKDQVVSIKPQISDKNGVDLTASTIVTWSSTNTNIVDFTKTPTKDKTADANAASATDDPNSAALNKYVIGKATGQATITATIKDQNGSLRTAICTVTVLPSLNRILVDSPGIVLEGQEIHLPLQYRDSDGNLIKNKAHVPDLSTDLKHLSARLDPADPGGDMILVRGLSAGAGILNLKLKNELGGDVSLTVPIQVQAVAAFKPIHVALDIMDEETAGQLFGQRTSKEFYVVRVRLFNNLDQFGVQFVGQSILAYSESIEAGIKLEKRYDPRTNSRASYEASHHKGKGSGAKSVLLRDDAILDQNALARGLFYADAEPLDPIALAVQNRLKANRLLDIIDPAKFDTTLREHLVFALNSVLKDPTLFLGLAATNGMPPPSLGNPRSILEYNLAVLRKSFGASIQTAALSGEENSEAAAGLEQPIPHDLGPRFWENVTENDFREPFTRSMENDDNTASNDKRYREHPSVIVISAVNGNSAAPTPIMVPRDTILDLGKILNERLTAQKQKSVDAASLLWRSDQPQVATVGHDNGILFGHELGQAVVTGTTISSETYVFVIKVCEAGAATLRPQVIARYLPTQSLDVNQSIALTVQEDAPKVPAGNGLLSEDDIPDAKFLAARLFKPAADDKIALAVNAALNGDKLLANIDPDAVTDLPTLLHNLVEALNTEIKKPKLFPNKDGKPLTDIVKPLSPSVTDIDTIVRFNRDILSRTYPGQIAAYQGDSIVWESTTEAVAQVEPNSSVVTAKYPGTALILARRNGKVIFGTVIVVPDSSLGQLPPSVFEKNGELAYLRHRFRYRPYSFEMMINTIDPRDDKTSRTKGFKFANALAMVGSFFTNVFAGQQTDAHRILNATSNMLIPGFEKLYPSMKDTERQNFVSMTMRPIEEIPFGADISRVLFFPKHDFHGILPGYQVRISEIDTSVFNIRVAIVDKTKALNVNAAGN